MLSQLWRKQSLFIDLTRLIVPQRVSVFQEQLYCFFIALLLLSEDVLSLVGSPVSRVVKCLWKVSSLWRGSWLVWCHALWVVLVWGWGDRLVFLQTDREIFALLQSWKGVVFGYLRILKPHGDLLLENLQLFLHLWVDVPFVLKLLQLRMSKRNYEPLLCQPLCFTGYVQRLLPVLDLSGHGFYHFLLLLLLVRCGGQSFDDVVELLGIRNIVHVQHWVLQVVRNWLSDERGIKSAVKRF